ncbi:MAG: hypothetical protein RL660_1227 [Bacteroidota bacterium]|jgi:hypothetical protein
MCGFYFFLMGQLPGFFGPVTALFVASVRPAGGQLSTAIAVAA